MKKPLLIIGAIVLILLIAGAGFYIIGKRANMSPVTTNPSGSPFGVAPSGSANGSGSSATTASQPIADGTGSSSLPILFKISDAPVAGGVIFIENKQEMIRYVDRATGHIYEVDPTTSVKTEIADNTVPKVYEAIWKPDGSTFIARTLENDSDTITNTAFTLTPPKLNTSATTSVTDTLYSVKAVELRGNLGQIIPGTTSIASVQNDTGGVITSSFTGSSIKTLFTSPYDEWRLAWSGSSLALTTLASVNAEGYAYLLSSGSLSKLLGPMPALTSLVSPDGSRIIYSYFDGQTTRTQTENLKSKAVLSIVPATFPEKCTWSTKQKGMIFCAAPTAGIDASEPDNWYQGSTHFSDNIWKINSDTGVTTLLAEPKKNFNIDLDLINPELSPNEDYLLFMNKTDLSLWILKLS